VIDADEECDPAANLTESCAGLGYQGGPLRCEPTTCTLDESFCYDCGGDPLTCPDAWTAAHNAVRASVNDGSWPGQPAADPDMPLLGWDDALSTVAANYAALCVWEHNANRSDDYAAAGGSGYVGENLYLVAGFTPVPDDAISDWASESVSYDYGANACDPGAVCGHYTQVVWAGTTSVGCAAHLCPSIDVGGDVWTNATIVVCDYAPGGNYAGERPY